MGGGGGSGQILYRVGPPQTLGLDPPLGLKEFTVDEFTVDGIVIFRGQKLFPLLLQLERYFLVLICKIEF